MLSWLKNKGVFLNVIRRALSCFLKLTQKYHVYFSIVILSMAVGEFYPFSMYPMYNSFNNESASFFFTDEHGEYVRSRKSSLGEVSHIIGAIMDRKGHKLQQVMEDSTLWNSYVKEIVESHFELNSPYYDSTKEINFHIIRNYNLDGLVYSDTQKLSVYRND